MPVLAQPEYTRAAIADVLVQSIPTRLLVINQGVEQDFREELELIAEEHSDRACLWSHQPPLPSLSATWNRALDFVWAAGGTEALVINNDVRLHRRTVQVLRTIQQRIGSLFVSCVGRREEDWFPDINDQLAELWIDPIDEDQRQIGRGGPDFSCFLISRACHTDFRFDERFIPAYCEDLDYHRRLLLAGLGDRIYSVNLPYLHYAAGTMKGVDDRTRERIGRAIDTGSRAYYQEKWGGPVNGETYLAPFGKGWSRPAAVDDGTATTPYLQAHPPAQKVEDTDD